MAAKAQTTGEKPVVTVQLKHVINVNLASSREDLGDLSDLKRSIKRHGLQVAVLLMPDFSIVDGVRRIRALSELYDNVDVPAVLASTWEEARYHLLEVTRPMEEAGWPHLPMSPLDVAALNHMTLHELFSAGRLERGWETRRKARINGHAPATTGLSREFVDQQLADMYGFERTTIKNWRDLYGAFNSLVRKRPEMRSQGQELLQNVLHKNWRVHSVLAALRAMSNFQEPGNRRFVIGETREPVQVEIPPADPKVAAEQEQLITRMINMLETMAGEVAGLKYINPAMSLDTAKHLLRDLSSELRSAGNLRSYLRAHIEQIENAQSEEG